MSGPLHDMLHCHGDAAIPTSMWFSAIMSLITIIRTWTACQAWALLIFLLVHNLILACFSSKTSNVVRRSDKCNTKLCSLVGLANYHMPLDVAIVNEHAGIADACAAIRLISDTKWATYHEKVSWCIEAVVESDDKRIPRHCQDVPLVLYRVDCILVDKVTFP